MRSCAGFTRPIKFSGSFIAWGDSCAPVDAVYTSIIVSGETVMNASLSRRIALPTRAMRCLASKPIILSAWRFLRCCIVSALRCAPPCPRSSSLFSSAVSSSASCIQMYPLHPMTRSTPQGSFTKCCFWGGVCAGGGGKGGSLFYKKYSRTCVHLCWCAAPGPGLGH